MDCVKQFMQNPSMTLSSDENKFGNRGAGLRNLQYPDIGIPRKKSESQKKKSTREEKKKKIFE